MSEISDRIGSRGWYHRPIPQAIAFPSDYALALATTALLTDYDRHGAINRLIEMAERLDAGESPLDWCLARRRVEVNKEDKPAC